MCMGSVHKGINQNVFIALLWIITLLFPFEENPLHDSWRNLASLCQGGLWGHRETTAKHFLRLSSSSHKYCIMKSHSDCEISPFIFILWGDIYGEEFIAQRVCKVSCLPSLDIFITSQFSILTKTHIDSLFTKDTVKQN